MEVQTKLHLRKRLFALIMAVCMILSLQLFSLSGSAADYIYDKSSNTAFITSKSAQWIDYENFLAELTITVNGTQVLEPLDVIICLDRSGSMDMDYIQQGANSGTPGTSTATHVASCPCLNQDHFYLTEINDNADIPDDFDPDDPAAYTYIYSAADGNITVYNAQYESWVTLDTSEKKHFYYEFGDAENALTPLVYGAYHFKMEGDAYVRISKWDTEDVRKQQKSGVWDHADPVEGCYDRWTEAKNAVSKLSEMILAANPNNNVALVPFSIRDSTMLNSLAAPQYAELKQWLYDQNDERGFFVDGVTIKNDLYDSKVYWTDDLNDIDDMLPRLFTTFNTDYAYAMSMAYNMLEERTPEAKETKRAVVVFLSDGRPYSQSSTTSINSKIASFANLETSITALTKAIRSQGFIGNELNENGEEVNFWNATDGVYQRHDVNKNYMILDDATKKYVGVMGQGAQMVTVSYMIGVEEYINRLKNMASSIESFIEISATSEGTSEGLLSEHILQSSLFPGGRQAVLRDKISQYYYVPEDAVLPDGVSIEGTIESGQTIVWDIGEIYNSAVDLSITVPLVLREQYRLVMNTTYYPTNDDINPVPDITTPDRGPDGPDTGAKLYYTDPEDTDRYDTIGTPKLEVLPPAPTGTADAEIVGEKRVEGWEGDAQRYYFTLTQLSDSNPANILADSPYNAITYTTGSGVFSFDVTELDEGEYWFIVAETDDEGAVLNDTNGWTYSKNTMLVRIDVVDNRQGGYNAVVNYINGADSQLFVNRYAETSVTITGTKVVNTAIPQSSFTFALTQVANAQGDAFDGTPITRTATIDGAGVFTFETIEGLTAGVYYFSVQETVGGGKGWANDTAVRIVTVTVAGDPLTAVYDYTTGSSTFSNTFTPDEVSISLTGTKTVTGGTLIPGQFNFAVFENNTLVATGTNIEGGLIRFGAIRYTTAGVHTYTVRETSVSTDNWQVDPTVYTVTVTVTSGSDGQLSVNVSYPTGGVVFNNVYTVNYEEPPEENVTLTIRKTLVDFDGELIGDGKKFAVRLYDEQMNFIGRYILSANQGSVVIEGLSSGTIYYLQEELDEGFEIRNFEIVGVGVSENSAVGLRIPTYSDNLNIEVIVVNEVLSLEDLPDEDPPLAPVDPPKKPEIIDYPEPETPETGDSLLSLGARLCIAVTAAAAVMIVAKRKQKAQSR